MSPAAGGIQAAGGGGPSEPTSPMARWMQEIVPYGIFTTDRDLRVTTWNEWMVEHSGLAVREAVGRRLPELYPALATGRALERYLRAMDGEVSLLSAALHKFLLPLPVTLENTGLPHMLQTARIAPITEGREVVGTVTVIEDVTQREVHAGILSRQQEIDRLLSDALATLLQSEDPAQEIAGIFGSVRLALNLDCFIAYLLSPDEKSLQLHSALGVAPKKRESIALLPLSALDQAELRGGSSPNGTSISFHTESLAALGLRGQCSFSLAVGDRVIGLVAFGSYERETIAAADCYVLDRLARYVAIALDRARREKETQVASRAKDEFLAALSHELRTPLNPVLLVASDAAAREEYPEEARQAFREIEKNALLEARLIDDLLDLTRIAHGKLGLDLQPGDLRGALRDALATVAADLRERSLALEVELEEAAWPILGDAGRLQQVFWNILKNAVKFTPAGGRIRVTGARRSEEGEIAVQIADSGIGMEPPELARVFEAFTQGDHALQGRSHRFGGLGLGLAISRSLVEMHRGRIEATSAGRNQGSVFTVYLPLGLAPAAAAPAPNRPALAASAAPATPAAKLRILLVEDHEATRTALVHLLTNRGYQVTPASTMAEALAAAARAPFELVLSDIGLPDGDGFVLMRQLRQSHGLTGIALTGYGMEEDLARSSDAGFLTHLTKPISAQVLDRTLVKFFQARRP